MSRQLRKKNINEKAQTAIKEMESGMIFESRLAAIQALIPLGLRAVEMELQQEITELIGSRYSRGGDVKRWSENPGVLST